MKTANIARLEATDVKNYAKQAQFIEFEKRLNEAIRNGATTFHVYLSIELIISDLLELGYRVTINQGEYNSTEYKVDFSEVIDEKN